MNVSGTLLFERLGIVSLEEADAMLKAFREIREASRVADADDLRYSLVIAVKLVEELSMQLIKLELGAGRL